MKRARIDETVSEQKKSRRGATLVLVAVSMTVLMMFAAFGIDFGRMYSFKAQLKVLTDAAALSAITDLKNEQLESDARARARELRNVNKIEGSGIASLEDADIRPVTWDFNGGLEQSPVTATWDAANAVEVTARYTADWSLARIFGVTNRVLTERSIAALGSKISSSCLAPVAVNYKDLLRVVGVDTSNTSYVITEDDIEDLEASGTVVTFKVQDQALPGSFSWVALDSTLEGKNKPTYMGDAFEDAVTCSGKSVEVGDTLHTVTGLNGNPPELMSGIEAVCPRAGGGNGNGNGNGNGGGTGDWNCSPQIEIQVPIYGNSYGTGNGGRYIVKYIGAVRVTRVEFQGNDSNMLGYLTAISNGGPGAFSQFPGPVFAAALVR